MELDGEFIIHFIWNLVKLMIAQGTDGVSRADISSGMMTGQRFLKYLPLNKTALERQKSLKENLLSWVVKGWQVATIKNWFNEVFVSRNIGWI